MEYLNKRIFSVYNLLFKKLYFTKPKNIVLFLLKKQILIFQVHFIKLI